MDRYELVENASSKFWEVQVDGATLTVRFGRIGTGGQTKDKYFSDAAAATKERDKLVREKTGKGYALVGEASAAPKPVATMVAKPKPVAAKNEVSAFETELTPSKAVPADAPAPRGDPGIVDAAAPATVEGSGLLFAASPLPTRTRPGPGIDAGTAWSLFRERLMEVLLHDKVPEGIRAALAGEAPRLDAALAATWIESIRATFEESKPGGWRDHSLWLAATRFCLEAFVRAIVGTSGAPVVAEAAVRLLPTKDAPGGYRHFSWSAPLHLALRAALVHASDDEYERAVVLLTEGAEQAADWPLTARYAFILADDRPVRHRLKPIAVLEAADAAGVDFTADRTYLPIIADAPPAEASRWRVKRGSKLYLAGCAIGAPDIAATLIAVARAAGSPAHPSLDWLLDYMMDAHRTIVAKAMLETREPEALAALLPMLHEKWIRPAFDTAGEVYPTSTFQQSLILLAGRSDAALRGRVADTVDRYGAEQASAWAREAGGKAIAVLDKLLASRDVSLADKADWPRVLREPPWRQKHRAKDDIVLDLAPIATPLAFEFGEIEPSYWRRRDAIALGDMSELVPFILKTEPVPAGSGLNAPQVAPTLPAVGSDDSTVLSWLVDRMAQLDVDSPYLFYVSRYAKLVDAMERQPAALALTLWSQTSTLTRLIHITIWPEIMSGMLRSFGERAVPGMIKLVEAHPLSLLPAILSVDEAGIAPAAARALSKLKKARVPARDWLRRHRETAMVRLVPDAVGKPGPSRDAAEHALRILVAEKVDGRSTLDAVVARYAVGEPGVAEAVAQVLERDPLARVPAKVGKPPAWVVPSALARPRLRGGSALPDEAVIALVEMLSFTNPDDVYAGIPQLKEACTADSLGAFAWDLFSAWMAAGAPSKDGWALRAVGWLGDDSCARELTRLIRRWPGESAHQRAVTGLDVLADIGSDVALMNLNGIAEKLKFKGLQDKARVKIAQLAEARGLSPEDLSDRLAPDLDLDERGGIDLDFGPRAFRVGFDETLKPWVRDASGQRIKDLPKPIKSDDAEKGAAAVARWGALKKDARTVASLQVARLEAMLANSRRVRPDVFQMFFAAHPLVRHLTQRLVWATFADADPRTVPSQTFRVAEDLSFTDAADEAADIDVSADANGLIGLLHPLHLHDGGLAPWGALFGDYEIAQPFPQLGRETYHLDKAEAGALKSNRFDGVVVESKRLRGMGPRGWKLGDPQDGGGIGWIEREFAFPDGASGIASLSFADGLVVGAPEFEDAEQTLGELTLESRWGNRQQISDRTFGALDPVTASELLRGPSLLADSRLR